MTDVLYRGHRDSRRRRPRPRLETGEFVESRGVIATALALGALTAGLTGGSALAAGAINSRAQGNAAKLQTDAATRAAEIQAQSQREATGAQTKSTEETLAFQKAQAAQDAAHYEAAQRGNYNQYVNKVKGAQALGKTINFDLPGAADYVPSTGSGGGLSAGGGLLSGPAPAVDPSKGDIGQQVSAYFKTRGVPDTETPYWVQKWQEFGQKDPAYFNQRLSQADIFGGGGAAPPSTSGSASPIASSSIASYLPRPPQVQPFQLRTINAFLK